MPMTYSYNPHRHTKIWLSDDRNSFLNLENQLRLVAMRETNPTDNIYFIFDGSLLSENAQEEMIKACSKEHKNLLFQNTTLPWLLMQNITIGKANDLSWLEEGKVLSKRVKLK